MFLRIGLFIFGLTIALLIAEIVAGHVHYPVRNFSIHRVPDPVLGWRLEPNAQYIQKTGKVSARVVYNSRGWHDTLHEYRKPSGVYRILVLGDSFMEGFSVGLDYTFATQLNRILKEQGKNVEVINLGVGGYGTLQEYIALKTEGLKYDPDLVLLAFFFGNDLSDNSLEMEKQIRGKDSMKFLSRPFLLPGSENEWNVTLIDHQRIRASYDRAVRQWKRLPFWKRTHLYGLFEPISLRWNPRGRREGPDADLHNFAPHRCQEEEPYQTAWMITQRILRRVKQDLNAAGAEFIVFTVPHVTDVEPALIPEEVRRKAADFCLDPPIGYDRLKAILNQEEIRYIDLLPEFRRTQKSQNLYVEDGHWNQQGHLLAAVQVERFLKTYN